MPWIDYLHVSTRGYACEIFINGAPLLKTTADTPCLATPTISEWLVHGVNEVTVRIDEIAEPAELLVQRCEGPLDPGARADDDAILDELSRTPTAPAPRDRPLSLRFTAATGRRWAWETAPVLDLDDATTTEVHTLLDALHTDLSHGVITGLLARQRIKIAELGPRYGRDPAAVHAGMLRQFAELSTRGAWSVAPLEHEDLVLRACCGGRLIEPRTRDGAPALRGCGAEWALPLFLARVGGALEIVR